MKKFLKRFDKKNLIIAGLVLIIIIGSIFIIYDKKEETMDNDIYEEEIPVVKHNVKVHIDFTENLILSRYNVILSLENEKETLEHGQNKDLEFLLEEGNYTLTFVSSEDSSIKNEITIDVKNNMEVGYKISCHYDRIAVENLYTDIEEKLAEDEVEIKNDKSEYVYKNYKDVIKKLEEVGFTNIVEKPMYDIVIGWTEEGEVDNVTINGLDTYKRGNVFKKDAEVVVSYHLKEDDYPAKNVENTESEIQTNTTTEQKNENKTETNEVKYNYFTTNDNETAKKGNTGVYSYIKKGESYDIYYIIDFDNGYVYYFNEGEDNDWCDKLKIKSGDLNSTLLYTYHDGGDVWDEALYFKYKNQPSILILEDGNHLQWEFSPTNLENALKLRDIKNIRDY